MTSGWIVFVVMVTLTVFCLVMAVLTEIRHWKKPDGVRALKDAEFDNEVLEAVKQGAVRENAVICNMSYMDRSVMLGDTNFRYCMFIRCKLIDDGPFSMEQCFMDGCTIQSANAGTAQAALDRPGERQTQKTGY